ncbi:element excision factor XisI family protein [Dapis sp. BLCC M172]
MANVEKYRQIIQKLLTEYATRRNAAKDGIEAQTIFDA